LTRERTAWLLGVFSAWLNELHALPDETLALLSRVELAIIHGDTAICGYFWLIARTASSRS